MGKLGSPTASPFNATQRLRQFRVILGFIPEPSLYSFFFNFSAIEAELIISQVQATNTPNLLHLLTYKYVQVNMYDYVS